MDKRAYLEALGREASSFAEAARIGLDAEVPCCPGWTVRDLTIHLGNVYEFWTSILEAKAHTQEDVVTIRDRLTSEREERLQDGSFDDPADMIAWFEERASQMEIWLTAADSEQPVWTWFPPDQSAGFVQRRMAQETAVHRWDCQQAHGREEPIEPELARDGIDEALFIHLPDLVEESSEEGRGESYHFHRTDGDGEWLVVFQGKEAQVSHEHAKADVAVRGTASDLLLFLWQRIPPDRLDVVGDRSRLDRYFELAPPE